MYNRGFCAHHCSAQLPRALPPFPFFTVETPVRERNTPISILRRSPIRVFKPASQSAKSLTLGKPHKRFSTMGEIVASRANSRSRWTTLTSIKSSLPFHLSFTSAPFPPPLYNPEGGFSCVQYSGGRGGGAAERDDGKRRALGRVRNPVAVQDR